MLNSRDPISAHIRLIKFGFEVLRNLLICVVGVAELSLESRRGNLNDERMDGIEELENRGSVHWADVVVRRDLRAKGI